MPDLVKEVAVGDELPPLTVTFDRARLAAYADASGDHNPIHLDEQHARAVGLPDVIAHGMLTMGAAVEAVVDWVGDPGRVVGCTTKFSAPVVVPAQASATLQVVPTVSAIGEDGRAVITLDVRCEGTPVLGRARVTVDLA